VSQRRRAFISVMIALVIGLGLACRRPWAPAFVQLYLGDVLWGALFYLLFAWAWPRRSSSFVALAAVATTELIEFSERYQADWILRLRATRLGGLLLGHTFLWSDVLCVFIGGAAAATLDAALRRRSARAAEQAVLQQ
jgi:hypothetical protein